MSIQSAKTFVERIKTDEEFSKKIKECKNREERMAFVKAAGFDFSIEEIKKVEEEISDGELDMVAGSGDCENAFCYVFSY